MVVEYLKSKYTPGTKLKLNYTSDEWYAQHQGKILIVDNVDDAGTIHCHTCEGNHVGLIDSEDSFDLIN